MKSWHIAGIAYQSVAVFVLAFVTFSGPIKLYFEVTTAAVMFGFATLLTLLARLDWNYEQQETIIGEKGP